MSFLRKLYDWAMRQAEKPYAEVLLFFVALIEPCIFPLPPDTLLIPMALARRDKAVHFAAIATLGSVLGAIIGYGIGALGMATVGQWLVDTYHLQDAFERFRHGFHRWGMWIILAKGLTPIPFILVTVASGVAHLNLAVFIFSAAVTRGWRFFLEAWLIQRFGDPVRHIIERHLPTITIAAVAMIAAGFWFVLR